MTEILLAGAKFGLLDRTGTVDRSLAVRLRSTAVLILEHSARVGDTSTALPEIVVPGEELRVVVLRRPPEVNCTPSE